MIYAMGNVTNDLGSFAAEVDAKNKAASDVRTTLQEVRDVIEDDEWPQEMSFTEYTVGEDGQVVATEKTVTLDGLKKLKTDGKTRGSSQRSASSKVMRQTSNDLKNSRKS